MTGKLVQAHPTFSATHLHETPVISSPPTIIAHAAETTFKDSEGRTAYLYTPADKLERDKVYWLVISVHGVSGDGKGAVGLAAWSKDDVLVLGPSFNEPKPAETKPKVDQAKPTTAQEDKLKADALNPAVAMAESFQINDRGEEHPATLKKHRMRY